MLYLLRWPNGDYRILDPTSLMASNWLDGLPDTWTLTDIELRHDVGVSSGLVSQFANHQWDISRSASPDEVNAWMPPGFELVQVVGVGRVEQCVVSALAETEELKQARLARTLRLLTHADEG